MASGGDSAPLIRWTSRLSVLAPGTIAAPLTPPRSNASPLSSDRPPCAELPVWQPRQCWAKMRVDVVRVADRLAEQVRSNPGTQAYVQERDLHRDPCGPAI